MFNKREAAAQEAEWRAESDLRTMQEYRAICKDPKRMKAVKEMAKKRLDDNKAVLAEAAEHEGSKGD